MLEGIRKRLRPGSAGAALSKVAVSGKEMAVEAVSARRSNPALEDDPSAQNYTVGMMSHVTEARVDEQGRVIEKNAEAIPWHAPDDPAVLNRMFGLHVSDV